MTCRCIVCQAEMENLDPEGNQPLRGLAFQAHGHYGCTIFDPMNGTFLEINVCDACLRLAAEKGLVLYGAPRTRPKARYENWVPPKRVERKP